MLKLRCSAFLALAFFSTAFSVRFAHAQSILITEIMYHPAGTNTLREWFEVQNTGSNSADLTQWRVSKGVSFTFPANTILPPGGFLVIASSATEFAAEHPGVTNFVGGWTGGLSGDGEEIRIEDASGNVVDSVSYAPEGDWAVRRMSGFDGFLTQGWEWFAEHDGGGKSLELVNPALPNENGLNWSSSLLVGGTPGKTNSTTSTNIAPLFSDVSHYPIVPRSTDSVRIMARVLDEKASGANVTLFHRVDGTATFISTPMLDDGAHGDNLRGDGIFGALLPPQADGTIVEFYLSATDADGLTRIYPAVIASGTDRTANLLYQVSNSSAEGTMPLYRIIIPSAEYAYMKLIWNAAPFSDAHVSGAFVSSSSVNEGTGDQGRYLAAFRNRGHGTRYVVPHNFRVDLPKDRPWDGRTTICLNTQLTQNQMLGSALMRRAGLPMAESRVAQVRVNGQNLAGNGSPQFGAYAANELLDGAMIERQMPHDPDGNIYRGVRGSNPGDPKADLAWHGPSYESYTNAYFKQNNSLENDWSDLISLLDTFNNTSEQSYVSEIRKVVDVREWMRYFAVNILLDNEETALSTGYGDDYALYRGGIDRRFKLLPYDMDSILGSGFVNTSPGHQPFRMVGGGNNYIPGLDRFMKHPEFVPIYFEELDELSKTIFDPAEMNPLLDQISLSFPPNPALDAAIQNMKSFNTSQVANIRSRIPLTLTATSTLPIQNGYRHATVSTVSLSGLANVIKTRAVLVNSSPALWSAWEGKWSANVALHPGLNAVLVQSMDAAGAEFEHTTYDVWFDDGTVASVAGNVTSSTTWSATEGPFSITSDLTIANGATLTIGPGTTVYLAPGAHLIVANGGRLLAQGSLFAPIRFTRAPGILDDWGGIVINGGPDSPETRIAYALIEFNGETAIRCLGATIALDHLTFSNVNRQYLSLESSSFAVSHCFFPAPNSGFEPVHGTGGIKAGGHGLFHGNFFGETQGYNDVLDFTGGNRPGPILEVIGNVFTGSSDDALDLDSTDAWIENNIFLHIHQNGSPDASSAVSGGAETSDTSEVTIIGNVFYDCDHVATAKQGAYYTLINNIIVHQSNEGGTDTDGAVINLADPGISEGAGMYVEGNVIYDAGKLVRNLSTASLVFTNNLMPFPWTGSGGNNSMANPLLKYLPRLEETYFSSWQNAQVIWDWFSFDQASPALGSGPNPVGNHGGNSPGVSISGAPTGTNQSTSARLKIGINRSNAVIPSTGWPNGSGYTHYKWRLDGEPWSAEIPINTPIVLNGLQNGPHQVQVTGRRDSGSYQDDAIFQEDARVTSTDVWAVDSDFIPPIEPKLRLNEILAKNNTTQVVGSSAPDLIELYNNSDQAMDLADVSVTDDPSRPRKFVFPVGSVIPARGYVVLYGGNDPTSPGPTLNFSLKQEGDTILLFDALTRGGGELDSLSFGPQIADYSIGRVNDAWALCRPTFGEANEAVRTGDPRNLRINEWLASAQFPFTDDFIEIYNQEALPVHLGGLFFSDAAGTPNLSPIPPLSFAAARGYLAFIADGNTNSGANHLAFKLASDDGLIALSGPDLARIDTINYGPQRTDLSQGRSPNGGSALSFFEQPTPGAPNPSEQTNIEITRVVTPLIDFAHTWSYQADGVDPGTSWVASGFDDSSWKAGQGLLGAESSTQYPYAIQTVLPITAAGGEHIKSYYFRTHFTVSKKSGLELWATNFLDDGAAFYINGLRVGDLRLPANSVSYTTDAEYQPQEGRAEPLFFPVDSLLDGDNVLAVEVHQSGDDSSDIVFGMSLAAVQTVTNIVHVGSRAVMLNEVLVINETPGGSWIELYNSSTNTVSLSGLSLTDDSTLPRKWVFSSESRILPGSYLVVYANPNAPASITNCGLRLSPYGGTVYLFADLESGGAALDAISYGLQTANYTIGRFPDGSSNWQLTVPTQRARNAAALLASPEALRINEWIADPATGADWFELFNPNTSPVSLGGFFFTDDLTRPNKSLIHPLSFIGFGQNGFARFFADKEPSLGANHVDFKLSKEGSELGLFTSTGVSIDSLNFGPQSPGVSEGRYPDGSANILRFPGTATPGAPNSATSLDSDGDGMPDGWETAHGLNPLVNDGNLDNDGDGSVNLDEYRAGTDPADSQSNLRLAVEIVSSRPVLVFNGIEGHSYRIEVRATLESGDWQTMADVPKLSSSQLLQFDTPFEDNRIRFFRVIIPVIF